jgi:DNA polymerase-3 subunit beta
MGLPEADFPTIPEPQSKEELPLPKEVLLTLVGRTSFAITADETRFAVAGGLLVVHGGKVALVATDGHRLAFALGVIPEAGALKELRVLLPRKTLVELRKLAESGDDVVKLSKDDKHVFFRTGSRTMISRILEGTFPQYEKVIPLGHPRHFVLDRAELLASIRRVAILSSDRTHAVRMGFKRDRIELEAESPELGHAREELPYEYDGTEMQVSFNAHYVLDFLGACGTEKVEMRLKDAETQALLLPFTAAGQKVEDSDYRYVIMPMRA